MPSTYTPCTGITRKGNDAVFQYKDRPCFCNDGWVRVKNEDGAFITTLCPTCSYNADPDLLTIPEWIRLDHPSNQEKKQMEIL